MELLASCWYLLAATILAAFFAGRAHTPLSRAILQYGKTRCDGNAAVETDASNTAKPLRAMTRAMTTTPCCQVPKRWFTWFYIMGVSCNMLVLTALFMVLHGGGGAPSLLRRDEDCGLVGLSIATVVYQLHLSRRLFECLCVTRFSKTATMHLFHLAFGMAYYVLVPLTLAVQLFTSVPSGLELPAQLASLLRLDIIPLAAAGKASVPPPPPPPPPTCLPLVVLGVCMMVVGGYKQYCCHAMLADLRAPARSGGMGTNAGKQMGPFVSMSASAVYHIPRGGLFECVSSPHYLCEIIVYFGLALAAGSNGVPPMVEALLAGRDNQGGWRGVESDLAISRRILMLWGGVVATTCINLYAAAVETHEWYRAEFADTYPGRRTALVPWLF
jgi:hypothetical protein